MVYALINLWAFVIYPLPKYLNMGIYMAVYTLGYNMKDIFDASIVCRNCKLEMEPADVVKSRVMNQPLDADGRGTLYRGSLDCLRKTVQEEGFAALYKGAFPSWLRIAPWSLTFFLTFEQLRRVCGLASF